MKKISILFFHHSYAMNLTVLVPLIAKINLGQQAVGFGLLLSALGIGALLGSIALAGASRREPKRLNLFIGAGCFCFFQIVLAFCHSFILALIILMFIGWAMITFTTREKTLNAVKQ